MHSNPLQPRGEDERGEKVKETGCVCERMGWRMCAKMVQVQGGHMGHGKMSKGY